MSNYEPKQVAKIYDELPAEEDSLLQVPLHLGYWDELVQSGSLPAAADRLTQRMMEKVKIQTGEHFCDLGCGTGGPEIALSKATGCSVDGFTISEAQCEQAEQLAANNGLSDKVQFFCGNVLEISDKDSTYDGGWFFESIFHMGHKQALQKASQILKPGAILVIADLPALPTATEEYIELCKTHSHSFVIPKSDYAGLFDEAGFDLIEIEDVTEFVMTPLVPNMKLACEQHEAEFMEYAKTETMSAWLKLYQENRGMPYVESEALTYWLQMLQDMCNNLGYVLITAQKRT